MTSVRVTLLFLTLAMAQDVYEDVRTNTTVVYPTMLPRGIVVMASSLPVEAAGPNMRCNEKRFCFELIEAAMGAYVSGVMNTSVASAVFTGEYNTRGYGVAYINQNSKKTGPSYPNKLHCESRVTMPNGTKLVEIYRFNRWAGKIEVFDNMTAVTNLSSLPVLGLYSPLLLPPEQQEYKIVIINLPADEKDYSLTFKLPDKTNITYYFLRHMAPGMSLRGWQDINFEAPDVTPTPTIESTTTSGAYRLFPRAIFLMAFSILAH